MEHAPTSRSSAPAPLTTPTRLFTVRIWDEAVGDGAEHRGEVREPATGAHRGFTRWEDLTSFLAEQLTTATPSPRGTDE